MRALSWGETRLGDKGRRRGLSRVSSGFAALLWNYNRNNNWKLYSEERTFIRLELVMQGAVRF